MTQFDGSSPRGPTGQFKIPFIEVTLIDRRLREWDGNSEDILTNDKLNIEVNTYTVADY